MERLIKLLKEYKEISAYKITRQDISSYQLFFIQNKIETNRLSETTGYRIVVYCDVNDKRGFADFRYAPHEAEEDVRNNIQMTINNAKLGLNPYFELPKAQEKKPIKLETNLNKKPLNEIAEDVAEAIFEANFTKECYSAATEIFINHKTTHIINSNGLDVKEEKYYGEIELIPTYEKDDKEVEILHTINFLEFDKEKITKDVNESLELVKGRFNAVELPKRIKCPVIFDCQEQSHVFADLFTDFDYRNKFTKSNLYEVGKDLQEGTKKDRITVSLVPYVKGAYKSSSIDGDGIILEPVTVIKDGVATSRFGSNQFAYYLKEKPTGILSVVKVEPGNTPIEDFKKKPYLRCVRFSNMQTDRLTGFLGGEVRLGYYFDGEKEIPVTGFTVAGDMNKIKDKVTLSKEVIVGDDYEGPRYIAFDDVEIA